ncbi:unnamed protein product [Allacma fusca]|uniref:Uncharacterized protein n=1 Tax=Allacma fusca TaxID=39272 RepID=A0A8J2K1U4_9HEXA|nr:unnamed protein product [Allacma fusca]
MVTLQLQQPQVQTRDQDMPPTYFEVVKENDLGPPPPYNSSITPPKRNKQIEANPKTTGFHPEFGSNSGQSSSEVPTVSQHVPSIPIHIAAIPAFNRHHNHQSRNRRHSTRHMIPIDHQPSQNHSTIKLRVLIYMLVVMILILIVVPGFVLHSRYYHWNF